MSITGYGATLTIHQRIEKPTLEALLADDTFAALLKSWEVDRRCPIALADYLREQGFEDEAVAAEWAATEPDRQRAGVDEARGPSPWVCDDGLQDGWGCWWPTRKLDDYDDIPWQDDRDIPTDWDTLRPFPHTLLWMLDYGARNVEQRAIT